MRNKVDLSRLIQFNELDSFNKRDLIYGLLKVDPQDR